MSALDALAVYAVAVNADHVQNVSDICGQSSSNVLPLEHHYEEVADDQMNDQSNQLNVKVDVNFELSRKELPSGVKHRLSPDARNEDTAVTLCNVSNLCVLMQCDQNLVSEKIDNDDRYHNKSSNDFTAIEEDSTLLILSSAVTLAHKCFKSSIQSLDHREAEHIDKHVSHTDTCKQLRLIQIADVVSVCKLH